MEVKTINPDDKYVIGNQNVGVAVIVATASTEKEARRLQYELSKDYFVEICGKKIKAYYSVFRVLKGKASAAIPIKHVEYVA